MNTWIRPLLWIAAFSQSALAQDMPTEGPIEMMDNGACWLQKISESESPDSPAVGYKFVSFGAGQAFSLYRDSAAANTLQDWIQTQLQTRFPSFKESRYSLAVHCYSTNYTISVLVERPGEQPVCLNARSRSGALYDFELLSLRPDTEYRAEEFCLGIEERALGMTLKVAEAAQVELIKNKIAASEHLSSIVERVDYTPNLFFAKIVLKETYAFRELEAKKQLEECGELKEFIGTIWVNTVHTIQGESRGLLQGTTRAY